MRAILLDVIPKEASKKEAEENLEELNRLVETYGGIVVVKIIQKRGRPSAKTFVGTGKALEISEIVKEKNADTIILNGILRPNQVMHLNAVFNIKIWDRIDLILNIFEKHAKSVEAKLQIELAKLKHEFPKLYGKGVELSRLGGVGGGIATRGPGEKLLESKKRHLRARIKEIKGKLEKVKKSRAGQRILRKRKNMPMIALAGYTNSGKSTLLKALTNKKKVYIADELFATLDTKIGDLWLPNRNEKALVADTIGFIKDLPPFLIESFIATLEEVKEADLLIHVIDVNDKNISSKIKVVEKILKDLDCQKKKKIYVFNKVDILKNDEKKEKLKFKYRKYNPVFISAYKKTGIKELVKNIEKVLE